MTSRAVRGCDLTTLYANRMCDEMKTYVMNKSVLLNMG